MSKSGFPQFPSTPKLPEHRERFEKNHEEQRVRITKVPRNIDNIRKAAKIRGEVIEQRLDTRTKEHVVIIRTEHGEIEVRLPQEQRPPTSGSHVEIQIQPHREQAQQAEYAIIRQVERRPVEHYTESAPKQYDTQPAINSDIRKTSTPVNIEIGTQPQSRVTLDTLPPAMHTNTIPRTTPAAGDIIRLIPLSPQENIIAIPTTLPDMIISSIIKPTIFQTKLIAQEIENIKLTNTINIQQQPSRSTIQTSLENTALYILPEQNNPLAINENTQSPVHIKLLLPSIKEMTAEQIFNPKHSHNSPTLVTPQLTYQQLTGINPALITNGNTQPQIQTLSKPIEQFIDIKIEKIESPQVQIIDPKNIKNTIKLNALNTKPLILHNQKPSTITGLITSTTQNNLPILSLFIPQNGEIHNFSFQMPAENLPIGTQLQITPQMQANINTNTIAILPPFSLYITPEIWPLMEELYQTLARTDSVTAQAFSNILPSPANNPTQLTPAALFFIAAMRGGELNGWLGDKAIEALRRDGKGSLLNRLNIEGSHIARLNSEPVSQDWRALNLPIFHDGEIQKIALYYKHEYRDSSNEQTQGKSTRFIFNLKLDAMGNVQLDGLFYQERLDIILRTETQLSQTMQSDMRQTYAYALKQTQVTGELSFQNQPDQWVTIQIDDKENFMISA
ncbi:MAG: hypothetical protein KAJ86_07660 [Alphaproteobacteria bacterium]|nr:hypothetical protein [Alphaproteobacteria bacterium]